MHKLETNIPLQRICAKWKGGLINEGGVISNEYGTLIPRPRITAVDPGTRLVHTISTSTSTSRSQSLPVPDAMQRY